MGKTSAILFRPVYHSNRPFSCPLQILIDGYPIEDLDVRWLREQIGFVGQVRFEEPPILFSK